MNDELYFPSSDPDWQRLPPSTLGWDANALTELQQWARDRHTDQLVALHRGRLVLDESWEIEPDAAGDVFAVQKALFALLLAIAEEKGMVHLDEPVSALAGTGWTQEPAEDERDLTVRHLLTMTTGLDPELRAQGTGRDR